MNTVTCKHCGKETPEGEICVFCGKEIFVACGTQVDSAQEKEKVEADYKNLLTTYRIEDPALTLEDIDGIKRQWRQTGLHPVAAKRFEELLKKTEQRLTRKIQERRMLKKMKIGLISSGIFFLLLLFAPLLKINGSFRNIWGLLGLVLRGGEGITLGLRCGIAAFLGGIILGIIVHIREIINGMVSSDAEDFTYTDLEETVHGMSKGFGAIIIVFLCAFVACWFAGAIADSTWVLRILSVAVFCAGVYMNV